jgi:hypothetical protein
MEWQCVDKLVRDEHGVLFLARRDLVERVVPLERAPVLLCARRKPLLLQRAQRRTRLDQMHLLELTPGHPSELRRDLRIFSTHSPSHKAH